MSDAKKLYLEDVTVTILERAYAGHVQVEIWGRTVNNVSHRVTLKLSPNTIGYIGSQLHRGLDRIEKTITDARDQLKNAT